MSQSGMHTEDYHLKKLFEHHQNLLNDHHQTIVVMYKCKKSGRKCTGKIGVSCRK